MTKSRLYIKDCGVASPLGLGKTRVANALFSGSLNGISSKRNLITGEAVWVGEVKDNLPELSNDMAALDCRNNRLMQVALSEIFVSVQEAIKRYGANRIAVVVGSSTSGIEAGEDAFELCVKNSMWEESFNYSKQELSGLSSFVSRYFGLKGPSLTIATACSSSAKVFASAQRMIHAGFADAAIVGGADTLCRMTLNGFNSLELLSNERCNPFSANRKGITIGEGASAFLLSPEVSGVALLGVGETSDAHHLTAPEPTGSGAREAMLNALNEAKLEPSQIDYINLHGTATLLNDAMEARAIASVFGGNTPCSSTKGMTGHMLGATGGCEAAFLWLSLQPDYSNGVLPPHIWDGVFDDAIPRLNFVNSDSSVLDNLPKVMLSNSFGFGGSNVSLILGKVT